MHNAWAAEATEQPLIIIGGGGHAKVLLAGLRLLKAQILGVTDPHLKMGETGPLGIVVIGDDTSVLEHSPDSIRLVNGIGSLPYSKGRQIGFETFTVHNFLFTRVIHPLAFIAEAVELDTGVQVMAGAIIQPGCHIGANCIVNTQASIDHDCRVGMGSHIAPGATLCGGVGVGKFAHIGAGAVVIQGVNIGDRTVVAAGAVVFRDVPDGVTVASSLARPIAEN